MHKYKELVEAARTLMFQIECHQGQIAKMALEACDIQRGGDHRGNFTLQDFSEDAGIPYGALKLWVGVYRDVFVKIDKPDPDKNEWKIGSKAYANMRSVVDTDTAKGRGYKSSLPKEKVEKLYKEVADNGEESLAAHQALKYAHMIKVTLSKVDLGTQNASLLSQILNTLTPVTSKVADHLTKKKVRA